MATENQKQLVKDIESAVAAIKLKNPARPPEGLSITEVCEMADRTVIEVRAVVNRLADKDEAALIKRIYDAFASVNLTPRYLINAMSRMPNVRTILETQNKPLEPAQVLTPPSIEAIVTEEPECKSLATIEESVSSDPLPRIPERTYPNPSDVVNDFIRTLDQLPSSQQHRIIATVSAYCGLGH